MNTTQTAPKVQLSVQTIKDIQNDSTAQRLAKAVFLSIAYVQTVREVIEPKQQEVIDFFKFKIAKQWRDFEQGEIIKSHKHLYLADESDWIIFDEEMRRVYKEVNLIPSKEGNCPLLEAESIEREAKRALVNYLESFTGLSFERMGISNYFKYLDIMLTILASKVNAAI